MRFILYILRHNVYKSHITIHEASQSTKVRLYILQIDFHVEP